MTPKRPPRHLGKDGRALWKEVYAAFELGTHQERILCLACEALDRSVQARHLLADEGPVVLNRFGEKRAHPAVAIERDSRLACIRAIRELNLGVGPDDARPPHMAYSGS